MVSYNRMANGIIFFNINQMIIRGAFLLLMVAIFYGFCKKEGTGTFNDSNSVEKEFIDFQKGESTEIIQKGDSLAFLQKNDREKSLNFYRF